MSNQQSADVSASVRNTFNFTVDKYPLAGPDNMPTPWYGLFRSDNMDVVGSGSVTSRYVPHTTDDVCALVEAAAEAFDGEVDCRTHFRHGHYVSIAPTKEHRVSIFGTADNVFPRFMVGAGYDGEAFRASIAYYRDACSNMHIMRRVSGTTVSIRHTSGLRGQMDDLIQTFSVLKNRWADLTAVIHHLESRQVNMVEFLNRIYEQPSPDAGQKAVTIHKNRTEAIFNRLYRERLQTGRPGMTSDYKVSAWEAFNAIQGYVQHESHTKAGFKGDFDRILKSMNDKTVHDAEKLALELAA